MTIIIPIDVEKMNFILQTNEWKSVKVFHYISLSLQLVAVLSPKESIK
ncbi:hypothetical protein [Bacillus weihaiensis]|nr:hypothetical protein [Bacillus weihaiensis]